MSFTNSFSLDFSQIMGSSRSVKKKGSYVPTPKQRRQLKDVSVIRRAEESSFDEEGMLDVSTVSYLRKCQLLGYNVKSTSSLNS